MATQAREIGDGPLELAGFLRARRAELDPAAAGLETTGTRRVRGLRREEVAQLAMISTDYYTRLEQGRLASASPSVLDALATALHLDPDERSYLFKLANKTDLPAARRADPEAPRAPTRRLLENLRFSPALVLGRHLDILAWNPLATAVFKDFASVRRQDRNFLRMLFLDEGVRGRYVDWEPLARICVGFVRASAGATSEARLAQLVGELSLSDPDFRTWWAEHHASFATSGTKTLAHPDAGTFTLDWQVLQLPDAGQILMVMTAPPDSEGDAALRRLDAGDD